MAPSKYVTGLSGLSLENAFYQGKGDRNPDHIPVFMVPAIDSSQEEIGYDLRCGAIAYATDLETFIFRKGNGHGGFEWVQLNEGGGGDVVGPSESTQGHIAIFEDETGKIISDSGVNIQDVKAVIAPDGEQLSSLRPLQDVSPTYSLKSISHLQFVNDVGTILVDSLSPVQFVSAAFSSSPGDIQICSIFSGELPESPTTPSCLVELQSTTGALVLSRMTTAQRQTLKATNGMLVYDTTLNQFWAYQNGAWAEIGGGGVPVPLNLTFAGSGTTFSASNTGSGEAAKLTSGSASALEVTSSSLQATILSMNLSDGPAGRFVNGGKGFSLALSPALDETNGGTGQTGYTKGDMLYASDFNLLSKLSVGSSPDGYVCTLKGGLPSWMPASGGDVKAPLVLNINQGSGTPLTVTQTAVVSGGAIAIYAASCNAGTGTGTIYAENKCIGHTLYSLCGSSGAAAVSANNNGSGYAITGDSNGQFQETAKLTNTGGGKALTANASSNSTVAIDTKGLIYMNGSAIPSSLKMKEILEENQTVHAEATELFKKIPLFKYTHKDKSHQGKPLFGMVAEHLAEVLPEAVDEKGRAIIPNLQTLCKTTKLRSPSRNNDRFVYELTFEEKSKEALSEVTGPLINISFDKGEQQFGDHATILKKAGLTLIVETRLELPLEVFAYGTEELCPYVNKTMTFELGLVVMQGLLRRIEALEQSIPWHQEGRKEDLH
jgi:hypothetical protein